MFRLQEMAVPRISLTAAANAAFVAAGYWALLAAFPADPAFQATLVGLDDSRVGLPGPGGGFLLNYADDPLVYRFKYLDEAETELLSAVGTMDRPLL